MSAGYNGDSRAYPGSGLYSGLTKRELIAAMALQGLLANSDIAADKTAKLAVKQADALLKELEK